ncbi:TetR family transcriptional regulator [Pseudoalteromonas sp. NBT06-2]|uniref:TetR/AcrR family transcriptional regulator n=1 Tax=Pseudoalteromonas sp. NBT06-2 TaxID=2025950 RepID=UPI000BA6829F|nr:TetR/AcrR family transcriptional regulator [Pseudoalteromonas sp. NBT06-2]PAJ75032.1 TetR family transcriptional regulator [Pseudoalteromonas sp. NBT06-2]
MSEIDVLQNRRKEPAGRIRQQNQVVIIAAAEEEFLTFGFKGASMKRIAERAELPRANIHYYFKNKLDLYGAVLGDIVEVWDATVSDINADDDPRETLTTYIRAKVMSSKNNPNASRIFASEMVHGAPHLSHFLNHNFRTSIKHKADAIQAWIDQGKMDPIDPMHLLFFIWGSTQHYADFGVQVLAAMDKESLSDEDFEDITETLTQLILKGCGLR